MNILQYCVLTEKGELAVHKQTPELVKQQIREHLSSIKQALQNDIFIHCRECQYFSFEKNSYNVTGFCDFSKNGNLKLFNAEIYNCKKKQNKRS